MFTGFDKAIVTFLSGLLAVLTANGINIPVWVTNDWLAALITGVGMPLLVYYWPNKS